MTNEPMTNEPMTNEPMTNEPMTNEPMTNELMTNEPMTDEAARGVGSCDKSPGEGAHDPRDIHCRTFRFGVDVIRFVRLVPRTMDSRVIAGQLIRATTSIGANVEEADGASTRKDFAYRIGVARREVREAR